MKINSIKAVLDEDNMAKDETKRLKIEINHLKLENRELKNQLEKAKKDFDNSLSYLVKLMEISSKGDKDRIKELEEGNVEEQADLIIKKIREKIK